MQHLSVGFDARDTQAGDGKMHATQCSEIDPGERRTALLLGELDHRMRNFMMMIEAAVRKTQYVSK